jgi:TolB-like protein
MKRQTLVRWVLGMFCGFLLAGCAYHMGAGSRSIPGGYQQIAIPVFSNKTQEVGVEVGFTNALIREFQRSKIARVADNSLAQARVEGSIDSIVYLPGGKRSSGDYLPNGTVIASEYRILIRANVKVVSIVDGKVLWNGTFNKERTYVAPQVTIAGVNSVNPLYNLSARRQNIDLMANDMMIEAHDRITENF